MGRLFLDEVHALLKKYEIPETWYPDFIADIAGKTTDQMVGLDVPQFSFYQSADGDWKWECIVTPETDLTNPFILDLIQYQQKEYTGAPPKPAKSERTIANWTGALNRTPRDAGRSTSSLSREATGAFKFSSAGVGTRCGARAAASSSS